MWVIDKILFEQTNNEIIDYIFIIIVFDNS